MKKLDIVYQDKDIIVVNKDAEIITTSTNEIITSIVVIPLLFSFFIIYSPPL